jgi:hypothetical protein
VVVSQNGNPRAGLSPAFYQPGSHGFGHAPQLSICMAFDALGTLDYNCNVLRPAFGALDEAIVKGRHRLRWES